MLFDPHELDSLAAALDELARGFRDAPPTTAALALPDADLRGILLETARRLHDNYPYAHPFYIGQMLKPPHPVARLAYALAMWINPNNHALDGGRASSALEKEVVRDIGAMLGYDAPLGHLCSGGTIANFEALWIARELADPARRTVLASSQAHYTHERLSKVLAVPFRKLDCDARGRLDLRSLERELARGDVGTVVVTLGATATGAVDPLPEVLLLRERHGFRLHVDTAYGGYFHLAQNLDAATRAAFDAISAADSIVIDPHKHGLQPYGCGCVLFRDASVGRVYQHDSPYTYFSSDELHLGEISLECSRPGAAAVALWATMRALPLERGGRFGRSLEACREAALALHGLLARDPRCAPLFEPQLDIVVWAMRAGSASAASARARAVFDAAAARGVHLALANLPRALAEPAAPVTRWDAPTITCLRACAMKPEHHEWLPMIAERLDAAMLATDPAA